MILLNRNNNDVPEKSIIESDVAKLPNQDAFDKHIICSKYFKLTVVKSFKMNTHRYNN